MRLLVFLFAIITTASTIRCYKGTQNTKLGQLEKLFPATDEFSSTFCSIKRLYFDRVEYFRHEESIPDYGGFRDESVKKEEKELPCSKPEYKNYTSDCFNPDNNTLCCRGDYCNYMPSLNCSEVYVPKKCPVGEILYHEKKKVGVFEAVRLKDCPADTKFCSFYMFNVKYPIGATYDCSVEYGADPNRKRGCGSNSIENSCYMPIGEQLSLNWGVEMFSEWSSAQEKASNQESSSNQSKHIQIAFLLVLLVIF